MRTTSPAQSRYKTRQAYLDATLELIHSAGVENLSMRKVARHLGVSPMAAYKHFANKDELMAAALDVFISQADVYPPQHLPWDQWMLYLARGMHRALAGEVNWIPVLGGIRYGEQAVQVIESFTHKMTASGFSAQDTVYAFSTMTQLVIGSTAIRASTVAEDGRLDTLGNYMQHLMTSDEPSDRAIAEEYVAIAETPLIETSLPLLIEALRMRLRASESTL